MSLSRVTWVSLFAALTFACTRLPNAPKVDGGTADATITDPISVDPSVAGSGGGSGTSGTDSPTAGTAAVSGTAGTGTGISGTGATPVAGTSASTAGTGGAGTGVAAGTGAAGTGVTCPPGTKACNATCIADTGCCTAMDCATGASCEANACMCPAGQHLCGNACVSDASADSCGLACMPCAMPAGGTAECVSGQCQPKCPSGTKICLGSCIAENRACEGQCPTGTHDCSGNCVDNLSPMTCGTSCRACATPSGGSATCDGTSCGIRCAGLTPKACTDHCAAQCCTDVDCGGNDKCVSGRCVCQPQCSGRECGSNGCGGSCGTCPANNTCTAAGQCQCQRSCNGSSCGANSDGCGGVCACPGGQDCISGQCTKIPTTYESCTPNSGSFGPGNCANGHLCVGVGGTGNFCYEQAGSFCQTGYFAAFGMICLKECNPQVADTCGPQTHCIPNGETGGDDPTVGYCIAPN